MSIVACRPAVNDDRQSRTKGRREMPSNEPRAALPRRLPPRDQGPRGGQRPSWSTVYQWFNYVQSLSEPVRLDRGVFLGDGRRR